MRKENTVARRACNGVFFELERSPTRAGLKSSAHMPKCTSAMSPETPGFSGESSSSPPVLEGLRRAQPGTSSPGEIAAFYDIQRYPTNAARPAFAHS